MPGEQVWWRPFAHFLGHTCAGAALFMVIAGLSVGLALWVKFLQTLGMSEFTLWTLTALEHIILVADVGLFLVYMFIGGIRFYRELRQ